MHPNSQTNPIFIIKGRNYKSLNYPKTIFLLPISMYWKWDENLLNEKSIFHRTHFPEKASRKESEREFHEHSEAFMFSKRPWWYLFSLFMYIHEWAFSFLHPAETAIAAALPLEKDENSRWSKMMKAFLDCVKDLSSQQLAFEWKSISMMMHFPHDDIMSRENFFKWMISID